MKILNVVPGSPEWIELRRAKIGASMAPIIMEADPYTTRYQLWQQMVQGIQQEENDAMRAGKALEPEARQIMSAKHGTEYRDVVAQHDSREWQIASLDGLSTGNLQVLEIKHTSSENLSRIEKGITPERWDWQLQHILSVTDLPYITLFVRDFSGMFTFEHKVHRDEDMIKDLIEEEYKFYIEHILGYVEPAMVDRDYVQRIDTEWNRLASETIRHKKAMDDAEEQYEACRKALIALAGDRSSMGAGVKLKRSPTKGAIDYKAIPELKDVDLEKYRKKEFIKWTLNWTS